MDERVTNDSLFKTKIEGKFEDMTYEQQRDLFHKLSLEYLDSPARKLLESLKDK